MCMNSHERSLLCHGNKCLVGNDSLGEPGKRVWGQSRGILYSMLRFVHFILKAEAIHSFFVRVAI